MQRLGLEFGVGGTGSNIDELESVTSITLVKLFFITLSELVYMDFMSAIQYIYNTGGSQMFKCQGPPQL